MSSNPRIQPTKPSTRAMALLAMSIAAAILIAGCAGGTASESANETSSSAVGKFAGTWELVEIEGTEDKAMPKERVDELRQAGFESYMVLNDDGTAVQVVFNNNFYGTWEAYKGTYGDMVLDNIGYVMDLDGSRLTLRTAGAQPWVYEKADDKVPMSKEDYLATITAFAGTWRLVSASRGDMTIEANDVGVDFTLAFNDITMQSTLTYDGESSDARWGVTDVNTGYIFNPVDGYTLSLADGTLTLDMGEGGRYVFAKE